MVSATNPTRLRGMSYGDMRRWANTTLPGLHIYSTKELRDTPVCGYYSPVYDTILISLGMTYAQKRCTLVHELVHREHGDTGHTYENRTRIETARILIDPKKLAEEQSMYETDYAQIAEDMDVTESVLADYLKSCGVTIQTAKTN